MKIIFITAPEKESEKIAQILVEEKLVACINIVEKIKSIYWWEGKICKDNESLLIAKTTEKNIKKVINRVKQIHSYEVPEIISVSISEGNKDYLKWITGSVVH